MLKQINTIFLADDDDDDCFLFEQALFEVAISTKLTTVHNGEELMHCLTKVPGQIPDILFLDLNMPRKNGFECLVEIKQHESLHDITIIIFSTSFHHEMADKLYESGADYFMRKPATFEELKKSIQSAILTIQTRKASELFYRSKEKFVLS